MKTYKVRWEIDIEAESPEAAADRARAIQLDPSSIATVFDVRWDQESGTLPDWRYMQIDLLGWLGGEE
jgi:hypothetical protein